jgi:hypothetical protein
MRAFEKNVQWSVMGILNSEECHKLYSSPINIKFVKQRMMRWAGHVTRLGGDGKFIQNCSQET